MKQKDSGQDFDPKHRIIGAIVVVVLAVILIPMILGEREPPAPPTVSPTLVSDEPPAEENKVAITRVTPPGAIGQVEQPSEPKAAADAALAPTPAKQAVKPVAEPKPAPVVAKTPAPAATKPVNSGWVVQVGTYSNAANATRLERKLRAEGQPVLTERITLAGGKAVRLRVGPFADRTAALKAQERIQKDVGVKGVVLSYP